METKGTSKDFVPDNIRQKRFWDKYVNPRSETYGNSFKSALAAGYSETYSSNFTNSDFFKGKMRRLNMLSKAEKVLDKTLDMETKNSLGSEQADLLRIQTDVAKHITKTLGKDEGYSERSEMTGKDGEPIVFMPAELFEKYNLADKEEKNV